MANEVARPQGGALAAVKSLKTNLTKVVATLPAGDRKFLRFLQDGNWVFGADNQEIEKGKDELALNPLSIKTGWCCWTDYDEKGRKNELLGEVLVPLGQQPPLKHELKDTGWEWKEMIVCDFKVMTGPHKGKQVQYSTNSYGGIKMMRSLIDQIIVQLEEDEVNVVPIIVLESDHYPHKVWGRTYTPEYEIVEFIPLDGPQDDGAQAEEPEQEQDEPADTRARTRPARGSEKREKPAGRRKQQEEEPAADADADEGEGEAEAQEPVTRRRRRS